MNDSLLVTEISERTEQEIAIIGELYARIVKPHSVCSGSGLAVRAEKVEDCDCLFVYRFAKEMVFARLPRIHWAVNPSERHHDPNSVHSGHTALLIGNPGSGKSRILTAIGKNGIIAGRKVLYLTAREIVDIEVSRKTDNQADLLFRRLQTVGVLLIDDLDRLASGKSDFQADVIDYTISAALNRGTSIFVSCVAKKNLPELLLGVVNHFPMLEAKSKYTALEFFDKEFVAQARQRA